MKRFGYLSLAAFAVGVGSNADQLQGKFSGEMPGEMLSGGPERIRWSSPHWDEPWELQTAFLRGVAFSGAEKERVQGSWQFFTRAGDFFRGELESVDDTGYLISNSIWGTRRIRRESIQSLERLAGTHRIFQASSYQEWAELGPGPIRNLRYRAYELEEGWEDQPVLPKFSELKLVEEGDLPSGRIDFGVVPSDRPWGLTFEGEVELIDSAYNLSLNSRGHRGNAPRWGEITLGKRDLDLDRRENQNPENGRSITTTVNYSAGKHKLRFEYFGDRSATWINPGLFPQNLPWRYESDGAFSLTERKTEPLPGWKESSDGRATAKNKGVEVRRVVTLPACFELDLELFSRHSPRFRLELAGGSNESFRLETWDDVLVVTRDGTFKVVRFLEASDREVRLRLRYDHRNRRLFVLSPDERLLVRWTGARIDTGLAGLRLVNEGQDLTLGRISITALDQLPESIGSDQDRVLLTEGEVLPGRLNHDAITDSWRVDSGTESHEVALDRVVRVMHPFGRNDRQFAEVKLQYGGNITLGGHLLKIDRESMVLATDLTETPLICTRKGLKRLLFDDSSSLPNFEFNRSDDDTVVDDRFAEALKGRVSLKTEQEFFYGDLQLREGSEPLWWLPLGAIEPQTVNSQFTGRFLFDPLTEPTLSSVRYPDRIWLNGNTFLLCRLISYGEDRVEIQTPDLGRRSIAVRHLRAVELARPAITNRSRNVSDEDEDSWSEADFFDALDFIKEVGRGETESPTERMEWELPEGVEEMLRLLRSSPVRRPSRPPSHTATRIEEMLRLSRSSPVRPPSHIAIFPNEDVMSGDLLGIDENSVRFRSRGRELTFDRDRVALIVRIAPPEDAGERNRIRFRTRSYLDLKIERFSVEERNLTFEHPVFGNCSIPFDALRILTLGEVRTEDSSGWFDGWRYRPEAAEPNKSDGKADAERELDEAPIP